MENIKFWQSWASEYQRPFKLFGLVAILAAIVLLIASWRSPAPTITWQHLQEREVAEEPAHQFQVGPFSLQTTADNILIYEKVLGNEFVFQEYPAYLFLAGVMMGFILLVTVLSSVSRFWFFIGSGLVIFLLTSLQLELLYVLGQENQYAAAFLMLMILGTGLAFQYYFQSANFAKRLVTFSIVIIASFSLLAFLSEAPKPVYFIAVGFIPATVIASALLAIFTAHEILATIIHLITRGLKGSNGFRHFAILSLIYLANLVAAYLNDQAYLKWEYSLNPILLLIISGTLGIWGIRRQQDQMDSFFLYGPNGPLAILGLSIVAFSASAFFYTTGNDAANETIRNMSLYAHIGFGVIFVLYVISNFGALLREAYPVSKVLYKPKSMPFFTFRLAGTITMVGFILYNFWQRPINDTKGARDAAMGDYYIFSGNVQLAEGFYKKSDYYAFHNHHANFVLANIEAARGNTTKERQYYLNAAERRPTEQAYMNAVNTLDQSAINIYAYLKNIHKDFPRSGAANNALGLVYAKLNQPDSALYYFNLAKRDRLTSATAEINLLTTAIKQNIKLSADSIYQTLKSDDFGPLANVFALANNNKERLNHSINLGSDTVLNLFSSSLINNYLLNQADSLDTAFISKAENLARLNVNSDYYETMIAACAHACYQNGQINRAFKLMQEATVVSSQQGRGNTNMALWALDQSAPAVAVTYMQFAMSQGYNSALLTQAIAFAEAGKIGEAIMLFDSLKRSSPQVQNSSVESILRILAVNKKLVKDLSDLEKYAYCRYRLGYADSLEFENVASTIADPDWHARAILDRSKKLFELDEMGSAIRTYNLLGGIAMSDKKLFETVQQHQLLMAASIRNMDFVQTKIKNGITWPKYRTSEKVYYESLIALASKDSATAKQKLNWLVQNNSYFTDGVLAAAALAKQNHNDQLTAYNILANAALTNPQSVRLLKAYIREAKALGFDEYAAGSLETLRQILPEPLFKKFQRTSP